MKQIRLSQGLYTLVNDEDYEWLMQWSWYASQESRGTKWYAIRRETVNGRRVKIRMHVEIVKRRVGMEIPPGHVVDHVNHNSLDNRFLIPVIFDETYGGYVHDLKPQLEVITQRENMRRSPGWKKRKNDESR